MPPKIQDRARINHELRKLGFGSLDDPNLIPQIAVCIRDHDQFRNQLFSVLPEQRQNAYNSLRPHLRFTAKPLDVYEAEIKQLAERQQLPSYNAATGELVPFKAGSVNLDLLATEAIRQSRHEKEGGLVLVCAKCTSEQLFRAKLRKTAEKDSHAAGWRSDGQKNYCPKCVPSRVTMTLCCTKCPVVQTIRAWDPQDGYASARLRGWGIDDVVICPACSMKKITVQ